MLLISHSSLQVCFCVLEVAPSFRLCQRCCVECYVSDKKKTVLIPYGYYFHFQALPSTFRQRGLTDREQMDSDIIREFANTSCYGNAGWRSRDIEAGRLTLGCHIPYAVEP